MCFQSKIKVIVLAELFLLLPFFEMCKAVWLAINNFRIVLLSLFGASAETGLDCCVNEHRNQNYLISNGPFDASNKKLCSPIESCAWTSLSFLKKSEQHLEFELWLNPQEPDPLAAIILECNWEKLTQNDSSYFGLISHFFLLVKWFVLDLLICNLPKDYFGSKIIHLSCYFPSSKWIFFSKPQNMSRAI